MPPASARVAAGARLTGPSEASMDQEIAQVVAKIHDTPQQSVLALSLIHI